MARRHRIKHSTPRPDQGRRKFDPRPVVIIAGVVIVLVLFIIAVSPKAQVQNSAEVSAIKGRGMLRVGVLSDVPGFSSEGEGLEPAIAAAMAEEIFQKDYSSLTLDLVPVTSHTADIKLVNGEIDLAIALLTAPESEAFLASVPYYEDKVQLYCAPSDAGAVLYDQTVGVVQNTPEAKLFNAFNEENDAMLRYMPFASYPDLIDGLKQGRVRFAAMPEAWARLFHYHTHTHHTMPLGTLSYVAVCHNDTPALVDLANLTINELIASGGILDLRSQYGV